MDLSQAAPAVHDGYFSIGKAHFAALAVGEAPVDSLVARTLDDVLNHCAGKEPA